MWTHSSGRLDLQSCDDNGFEMESEWFHNAVWVFSEFLELYDLQPCYCGFSVSLDLDIDDPLVVPWLNLVCSEKCILWIHSEYTLNEMSLSKWISEIIPIWRFHFSISRTLKPSISEGICLFSKLPISLCLSPSASEEYGVISSTVIKTQIGTISGFQKYHSSWFQNTRYFDSNKYHGSFHELADRLPRFSFASRRARQGTRCR